MGQQRCESSEVRKKKETCAQKSRRGKQGALTHRCLLLHGQREQPFSEASTAKAQERAYIESQRKNWSIFKAEALHRSSLIAVQ